MKEFKVDRFVYFLFPLLIVGIMILYFSMFFKVMPTHINVINIAIDIILIMVYLRLFVYDINIDGLGINFKGVLRKKRILVSELNVMKQGGILTLIKSERGRFFVITFKKDKESLKNMFKDV
ncbi:MAG: hypothetical protein RSA01_08775 [Clostridium sp.]